MATLVEHIRSELLDYQWDLLASNHPREVWRKSRRIGLTWASALKLVLRCQAGRDQTVVSHRYDNSKLVISDCGFWVEWLAQRGFINARDWDVQVGIVRHKGHTIQAIPCVPKILRGRKGDVLIDEAAFIPTLPEFLDAARPLRMWGGHLSMISSPFLPGLFTDLSQDPQWVGRSIDIHEAVSQHLYKKIQFCAGEPCPTPTEERAWVDDLLAESGRSAAQEYLCQDIADMGGDWITEESRLADVPIITVHSPEDGSRYRVNRPHSIGVDVGVAQAPTTIAIVDATGLCTLIEVRDWKVPTIALLIRNLMNDSTEAVSIDTNGIGRGVADSITDPRIKYTPNTSQWFSGFGMRFLGGVWGGTYQISSDPVCRADFQHAVIQSGKLVLLLRTTTTGPRHCDTVPALAMSYEYQPTEQIHGIWG